MNFLKVIIGGMLLGICTNVVAQMDINTLFQPNNKNILYSNQARDYTESPLVFIEGISDKISAEDEAKIIKPLPPLEHSNIQNSIIVNPTFGKKREVAFVPHTANWNFIIQILNDDEISIQEEILFIKTKDIPFLKRDWPKSNLFLTEVRINGKEIPAKINTDKTSLFLKLPELETGVHKLHLAYTIKGSGHFEKNAAYVPLPLTGSGWNLPTNSLRGIILFPNKIKHSTLSFLFGKNKLEIKEAFQIQKDSKGALFFSSTNLIPANSAIQLNLNLQYDSFIKKGLWDKLTESTSFLIFLISLLIILAYLILNLIEVRLIPVEELAIRKKHTPLQSNPLFAFFSRTGEICIGIILLWGCSFTILYFMNNTFSGLEIQILILFPIVFIFLMDYFLLRKKQQKLHLIQASFNKDIKK